jgi:hypothetical protein
MPDPRQTIRMTVRDDRSWTSRWMARRPGERGSVYVFRQVVYMVALGGLVLHVGPFAAGWVAHGIVDSFLAGWSW